MSCNAESALFMSETLQSSYKFKIPVVLKSLKSFSQYPKTINTT